MQSPLLSPTPRKFKKLPGCDEPDGWALIGDLNFPGPGYSSNFRTRPTNYFDLASKLHDAAYHINDLHISLNPLSEREPSAQSKKARADSMFRVMNKFLPEQYWSWSSKWNWGARQIFDGTDDEADQSEYKQDDGYLSVFHPCYMSLFSNSTQYLMIPYCALPTDQQPVKNVGNLGLFGQIKEYAVDILHQNYRHCDYHQEVRMDRLEPFSIWFQRVYAPIWPRLLGLGGADGVLATPDPSDTK